jgi:hypothetical protein
VELDDAAALVLGDLGVLDGGQVAHAAAGDAERFGDQPAQGDGEPAPQVGRPPLPHGLGRVVVAIRAQRLTQLGVVIAVPHQAARRPTVQAAAGAAERPSAGLDAVHVTERRCGERGEQQRVFSHRFGHGLAADDTRPDEVEDIGRVDARTGRAH